MEVIVIDGRIQPQHAPVQISPGYAIGHPIEVSYLFGYDPDGWNGSVNGAVMHGVCLRPGTFTPTPVATYDTAGAETGTRNILVWQPKTGTGVEPDRVFAASKTVGAFLYPEGDFSKLHALATW